MPKTALATLIVLSTALVGITSAAPLPSGSIPLPVPRPDAVTADTTSPTSRSTDATLPASRGLKSALQALGDRNTGLARAIRDALPRNTLDRHILTWAIALSGLVGVPAAG